MFLEKKIAIETYFRAPTVAIRTKLPAKRIINGSYLIVKYPVSKYHRLKNYSSSF